MIRRSVALFIVSERYVSNERTTDKMVCASREGFDQLSLPQADLTYGFAVTMKLDSQWVVVQCYLNKAMFWLVCVCLVW